MPKEHSTNSSSVSTHDAPVFRTTHWSVVLAARDSQQPEAQAALARLCQTYWYPLYCCVRRHGRSPEDAQDLTQAFFAKLIEKNQIALADQERGRFRTFLLRSLENFLRSEYEKTTTQKRGGGREIVSWDAQTAEDRYLSEPATELSPEQLFERRWASTLITETLTRLRRELSVSGRDELFDRLEPHLWGDDTSTPYAAIAAELDMTVVAVKVTVHRLRSRYRNLLREQIAETVAVPEEVEDEMRRLFQVLTQ
ncbi:MAG: sigma-70 family RNA polymerase sigma factor [Verrucomicrobiales bacterium]|nr:sigma-70 family RNA polymerase sigma factor [Verrucomicrobiales bacterium]